MKLILVISVFFATSVALPLRVCQNNQELQLTDSWSTLLMLRYTAVKIRTVAQKGAEQLKTLVLNDNPDVGAKIAAAVDETVSDYIQLLDQLDAKISARTLTLEMFKKQFWPVRLNFYSALVEVHELLPELSNNAQDTFMDINLTIAEELEYAIRWMETFLEEGQLH